MSPDEKTQPASKTQSGSKLEAEDESGSGRGALIAMAVLVVLALGGWWLAQHLRAANRLQDCVMAGRSNCAPVQ